MQESIHGHQVLNFIGSQPQALPHQEQVATLIQHFGEHQQFHTCRAKEMTAEQLVTFFLGKGKLAEKDGHIVFVGCQCKH